MGVSSSGLSEEALLEEEEEEDVSATEEDAAVEEEADAEEEEKGSFELMAVTQARRQTKRDHRWKKDRRKVKKKNPFPFFFPFRNNSSFFQIGLL